MIKTKKLLKRVLFLITEDQHKELCYFSKNLKKNNSLIIREALNYYLNKLRKKINQDKE